MFTEDFGVLSKLLEVSALRHKVVSHNIANLNTPGFQRKTVVFESLLNQAEAKQSSLETQPKVVEEKEGSGMDGNSSSLEQEMHDLTQNSLMYQVYMQAISYKIKGLESAIAGRSR